MIYLAETKIRLEIQELCFQKSLITYTKEKLSNIFFNNRNNSQIWQQNNKNYKHKSVLP